MPINSNISSLNSITPSTNNLIGDLRVAFEHSYFNILLNNIYGARKSSYYFDVDYSSTQFRPVNLSLLLSQSAAIATVQDSNYTSKRVISSRYEGSKTISDDYQLAGRSSYGPNYTVDWTTPYFGVFEETSDSFPKGTGASKLTISKLVYRDGTIIPLDNRNSHLFDIQNIFIPDKKAYIYYTEKSGGLNDAINVETKSIDESGFLYHSLAFYKPTNTPTLNLNPINGIDPDPYKNQEDNVVYYSFLNTNATSSIYNEEQLYGFNNLIAQKQGKDKELYFYFGLENTASAGTSPYNSTGYFIGMGLILRNFYPGTGEQYSSYRRYPWVRFQWMSTGSIPNYNLEVNTDLLPLRAGDYVRIYDATEAQINDEVYSYDKDIFFLQNASGSIFQDSIYDSLIESIEYTLPSNLTFLSANGGSNLVAETFLISNNSASVYKTTDRFGDVPQQSGPSTTELLEVYNVNGNRIDVNGSNNTLGKDIQFKKLYKVNSFTEDTAGLTYYEYWAIGTSGSLYRAEGATGLAPFVFEQVPDTMINPSCSFNAMFFLPNSLMTSNLNRNNSFTDKFYKRGIFFAVGDSGSIYASNNYGNTFYPVSFPRTDINLYDVFYNITYINPIMDTGIDFIVVVGSSGSIYMSSGSANISPNLAEFNPSSPQYSTIPDSWFSGFLYNKLIVDSNTTGFAKSWPSTLKRENLTFNRIIEANSYYGATFTPSIPVGKTLNLLYFLSNSGSIFYPAPDSYIHGTTTNAYGDLGMLYDARDLTSGDEFYTSLYSLTGSFINSQVTPPLGYTFPASASFIDGLVSGSVYESPDFETLALPPPIIKALWLNKTGSIYFNSNLLSSSYDYTGNTIFPSPSKIFQQHSSASFNEIKQISTIDYSQPTPVSIPYIWIPSSQRTLLYQSASGIWAGGTVNFDRLNIDNIGYFSTASYSNYPTASFYSIIGAEDSTGASSIYVKLNLRSPFPSYFSNGGDAFAHGINPFYGPSGPSNASGDFRKFTGTRQAWRLYRKYSNEQYVLTKEYVPDGKGFIVPENYDPSLNYIEVAKKAGLIF